MQVLAIIWPMTCSIDYAPQLRSLGFRVTAQRMAILHVLLQSGSHLSPAEIYRKARRGARGLAQPTVYRTLEFLAQNGMVQPALNAQKHLVYQIARHGHHHLICGSCGNSVEVRHDQVHDMYRQLETESGYHLLASHLTLFGLCPACQEKG